MAVVPFLHKALLMFDGRRLQREKLVQQQELLRSLMKFSTERKGCNYATYRHINALLLSLPIHTHSTSSRRRLSLAGCQFHHPQESFRRDTSSQSCPWPVSQCLTVNGLLASTSSAMAGMFSYGTILRSFAGAFAVASNGWGTSSCVSRLVLVSNVHNIKTCNCGEAVWFLVCNSKDVQRYL